MPSFNSYLVTQQTADVMNALLGIGSRYGTSIANEIGSAKWGLIDKDYKQTTMALVSIYTDHLRNGLAAQHAYEISLNLGGVTNRIDRMINALEDAVYGTGKSAKAVVAAAKANGVNQVKATQTSLKLQMLANDIGKIAADWERFEREEHRKPNWTAYARFRNRWLGAWYDIEVADRDFVTERIPNRAGLDDLINAINEDLPSPAKHLRKVEQAFRVAARQTGKS